MLAKNLNMRVHPAAEWALSSNFGPVEVDCTTAVVLKILDNKCKMLPGEKSAVLAIYDAVKWMPSSLFDVEVHQHISQARDNRDETILPIIHKLRIQAENNIPKPVMTHYKALLREGLFG